MSKLLLRQFDQTSRLHCCLLGLHKTGHECFTIRVLTEAKLLLCKVQLIKRQTLHLEHAIENLLLFHFLHQGRLHIVSLLRWQLLQTNAEVRNLTIEHHKAVFAVSFSFLKDHVLVEAFPLKRGFNLSHLIIGVLLSIVSLARLEDFNADVFEFIFQESDVLGINFTSCCHSIHEAFLILLHILGDES